MAAVTVNNFLDLKNALSDATSTEIYLNNDIVFNTTGGAIINKNKGDIIIDGNNHTITDYDSSSLSDTIRFSSVAGTQIMLTIKNVTWNGRNIYGVTYIPDSVTTSNVTLQLQNMQYTGPQAVYNRHGTTLVENSVFNIQANNAAPQEFGEVNRISFSGDVTINSSVVRSGATYSVIWFANSDSWLKVEDNAKLTVQAPTTYMFYADGANMPSMTFGANSSTQIDTQTGLFYNGSATYHMASSFTLNSGAAFTATQSQRNGAVPFFKCQSSLTLQEGSIMHLAVPPSGTAPLIYFSTRAEVDFNNPKSVVLYNNGGNVFSFNTGTTANPNQIAMTAELMNIWMSATAYEQAGKFDDIPSNSIAKADGTNITAEIKTTSSVITDFISNIAEVDKGFPMDKNTFNVLSAKVLSLGNLDLSLNQITDLTIAITGSTEPLAYLRALYDANVINENAAGDGAITLPVPLPIPADTNLTFGSNWNFLTKYIIVKTVGSVSITYLPDLAFNSFVAPSNIRKIKRKMPNWYLQVTDTRTEGGDWYLYASLPLPLSNGVDTLNNCVMLEEHSTTKIISSINILIMQQPYSGTPPIITEVTWSDIEGFFLSVVPYTSYSPGRYISQMHWEVRTDPID